MQSCTGGESLPIRVNFTNLEIEDILQRRKERMSVLGQSGRFGVMITIHQNIYQLTDYRKSTLYALLGDYYYCYYYCYLDSIGTSTNVISEELYFLKDKQIWYAAGDTCLKR